VPLIFAHRGLHTTERENTLAAFWAAGVLGVDGVELDVRRCGDGQLVVHHDATIAGRALVATTVAELPDYVPTLADALGACTAMTVNVEIKNMKNASEPTYDAGGGFAREVVDLVRAAGRTADVVVSCFDLATCRAAHEGDPGVRVGWLLHPRRDVVASVAIARDAGLQAVHPHHRTVDVAAVAAAHDAGLAVNVWTVSRRRRIAVMIELGVDGLITDDPASALALVGRPVGGGSALA
jgi:glycerophosphoryl diester phosphodiesterase